MILSKVSWRLWACECCVLDIKFYWVHKARRNRHSTLFSKCGGVHFAKVCQSRNHSNGASLHFPNHGWRFPCWYWVWHYLSQPFLWNRDSSLPHFMPGDTYLQLSHTTLYQNCSTQYVESLFCSDQRIENDIKCKFFCFCFLLTKRSALML